ncbi:hypothetical protein HYW55_00810 [Candidatus Gottesmanbacteria bacterium]|nr:hypothetical protein [Candidatus Gottesmanbacteria bacterium]
MPEFPELSQLTQAVQGFNFTLDDPMRIVGAVLFLLGAYIGYSYREWLPGLIIGAVIALAGLYAFLDPHGALSILNQIFNWLQEMAR